MQTLNNISPNQTATQQASALNQNFSTIKSAIESGEGGSSSHTDYTNKPNISNYYEKTTKVLALGNSFTYWPLLAFGAVANLTGKDSALYDLQTVCKSGTGLSGFCSGFSSASTTGMYTHYGSKLSGVGATSFQNALSSRNWDAVVLQQLSGDAIDYSTYRPYLDALIQAIRRYSTNPTIMIGWQMIWDKNHYASSKHRDSILENTRKVMEDFDIDFVVPTGTAFENAWDAGLLSGSLTSWFDSSGHTTSAETQFLASATWYQTLFKALLEKDIVEDMTADLESAVTWTGYNSASMTASVEYCKIAARCAAAAVEDMWNVTTDIS